MAKTEQKRDDNSKMEDKGNQQSRAKMEDKGFTSASPGGPEGGFFGGGGLVVVSFIGAAGIDVRQMAAGFLLGNGNQGSNGGALGDAAVKAQSAARKRAEATKEQQSMLRAALLTNPSYRAKQNRLRRAKSGS